MRTIRTIPELREALRDRGDVGLVPTMGAFHEGHLSLFRAARAESDVLVASLFVNAAQFGDPQDLAAYPRGFDHDAALAEALGLRPFDLDDEARSLYHAGAAIASNYLVTLHGAASRLFEAAGAPPEALVPLMKRTIENGFELTGPIARGDWETVDGHMRAIHEQTPELETMYRVLAEATRP